MDAILVQCLPRNELKDTRYQSENLALGYLAAALRTAGYIVAVLDANLEELGPDETASAIMARNPCMVGFTSSAQDTVGSTVDVMRRIRRLGYPGHITVGGHFPTYEDRAFLENVSEIDSVMPLRCPPR